jgi:hypothetical protein
VRPAWSSDGNQFAFLLDEKTLIVNEFLSGKLLARIGMDKKLDLSKEKIELSFSPDNTALLLKVDVGTDDSELRFFSLETKKIIGEWQHCHAVGVWMYKISSYATTCIQKDKDSILLLHPNGTEVEMREVGNAGQYKLLNVYDSVSLLVRKGDQAGRLMLTGSYAPINVKQFEKLGVLDAFINLERALADKIQQEKKTDKIDDLVVAPSNTFAIFHTQKGIWVIDLPKFSQPYFLFAGDLPSVRP